MKKKMRAMRMEMKVKKNRRLKRPKQIVRAMGSSARRDKKRGRWIRVDKFMIRLGSILMSITGRTS